MGKSSSPTGSRSITVRTMGGATGLLAEVRMLEGMTMRDVLTRTRGEGLIGVSGVGVGSYEGRKPEGWTRDWEVGEE